ncbi:HNH endonuclease-domain-containing protein [Lipomyces chichibuensis]|uniref:HNH endonuclease-domain-containing protein n=1 Tax=Lipomyces chichibuensis TaxID=1546026 RepID=UPI0033441B0C
MAGRRRNVFIYDASRPDNEIGGLRLNPSVSKINFLSMLDILIIANCPYAVVLHGTNEIIEATDERLQPGRCYIQPSTPEGRISMTDEPCALRTLSHTRTGRDEEFRNAVRERDGRCVITGVINPDADIGDWPGFEAAHIFPLSKEDDFIRQSFSRWITNRMGPRDTGINSCQNGLLMRAQIHQHFDAFRFSINVDDNYKIISFDSDIEKVDGRTLEPICRAPNDERSVRDELLRWHFRQAVLANTRKAGEPIFEFDFPPGTDMLGDIVRGPKSREQMEAELFTRLWPYSMSD